MTYASGGLIEATDYNGFVSTGATNINTIWGTGAADAGWGQTALSTVSAGGTVTATNWASLVNTLSTMGSQSNTLITSRTAPTSGQTISVLAAVATDISSINTNRSNAAAVGTTSTTWTGSAAKTTTTGSGNTAWTITWTQTVTFPSAAQARYFFNAGGRIYITMNKSSTGLDSDADWNTFIGKIGTISFTGLGASKTLAGTAYTGTTRTGGTGGTQTTLSTATGFYSLVAGAAATTIVKINDDLTVYTGDFVQITVALDATSTILTFVTTWVSTARTGAGQNTQISGGTDTTSPFSAYGTAPAVICRFVPPSTTYLTNSWGTPTVASSVA